MCFSTFSVIERTYADSWSDMAQPCDMDLWVMKWRSAWLIFHGPMILPYILKSDVCTLYFGSMNQYDQTFDLKTNVGHWDLYFMVQWFCLISLRLFDVWTSLFGIVNQYDPMFDLRINVGYYDLYFMVQCFCIITWKIIWCMNIILWDYASYHPAFDLKINVCHCDLYFMVQWFCHISKTIWLMIFIFSDRDGVIQTSTSK